MTRYRIEPTAPQAIDAYGLSIPPGGIERELDEATLGLLAGDARVTVTPVEEAPEPRRPRGKRS